MAIKMLGSPAKDMLSQIELDEKENFSVSQVEKFKSDAVFYKKFVKAIEKDINGAFPLVSTFLVEGLPIIRNSNWLTSLLFLGSQWKSCSNLCNPESHTIHDGNAWWR